MPNWSTNVGLAAVRLTDPVALLSVREIWRALGVHDLRGRAEVGHLHRPGGRLPAVWLMSIWDGPTSRWLPFVLDGALPTARAA